MRTPRLGLAALLLARRGPAALLLVMAGCHLFSRPPPPAPTPAHYVVGDGYQAGGAWYYPQERTTYAATGLATIAAPRTGLTADGETFDPAALAAAHQTLQLPAIARVTNLDNGRVVLLRLNDRGPANPARLLALTPHAADLLLATDGSQIRVQLDEAMTHALAEQLGGGPRVAIDTAPRETVVAEALPPPPGAAQSPRAEPAPTAAASTEPAAGVTVPDRLPDAVLQGPVEPGQIYLRASEFGRVDYAYRLRAQLYGLNPEIETVQDGRTRRYRVRAGPFATVPDADAALDQARRAGVVDAILVVE